MVAANSYLPDFQGSGVPPQPSNSPSTQGKVTDLDRVRNGLLQLGVALFEAGLIDNQQFTSALASNSASAFDSGANTHFLVEYIISRFTKATPLSRRTIRFLAKNLVFCSAPPRPRLFGTLLMEAGLLDKSQVKALVRQQRRTPAKRLGELAVERGWLDQQTMAYLLESFYPNTRIELSPEHPSVGSVWKRALDIVGASVGLVIVGLLFIPIAIAIKRDSDGPILYSQVRCGLRGKPFRMWKFRSMCQNAERQKKALVSEVNGQIFKQANDPRITRVGKFLRCTSLDELASILECVEGRNEPSRYSPPNPQ